MKAVHNNLDVLRAALNEGVKPEQVTTIGFIHGEPRGALAITEKGGHGKGLKATRLYVYLDRHAQIIHLIALGDKASQRRTDIKYVSDFVTTLRNNNSADTED